MTGYLVDTNIISMGAPGRPPHASDVLDWMEDNTDHLYLSVVTIAEVQAGIAKLAREMAARRASRLAEWLEAVLHLYAGRVLPIDVAIARVAGSLSDLARERGQAPGFPDIAIAATASVHGLTILTRNPRHFEPLGIAVRDPFSAR